MLQRLEVWVVDAGQFWRKSFKGYLGGVAFRERSSFHALEQGDRGLLGTTLSKVLKRVYGEGRPSEWNVGMSEERVFQKEFWDFLRAGALRVILREDCEGWAGRSSTEDLREAVRENSRRKISRKSLLVKAGGF